MPDPAHADTVRKIEAAVQNLPRLQRDIFLAHRLCDLPYKEIARRTGLEVHAVERHMAQAIYKLAKQLDGGKLSWWERRF